MTADVLSVGVLNGPNLDLLGSREKELYGEAGLEGILSELDELGKELDARITAVQSNHEGELADWIRDVGARQDGLLVNAAAYTHTSVAVRDALLAAGVPFVEVHLTNIWAREPFRHHSLLSDIAVGVVSGFGSDSYLLGMRALASHLRPGA
ncbi:MAG: type II 3-dehydroquinate dehydratase [Gemmatimonadetes bacterium]|nr:type II 3-dehydroquinate dehydratase [Gemmatimonadota bacterium]MBT8477877.1 type II 3-dehydroquinate dehydratase [Gemmatimonadota bacterium]